MLIRFNILYLSCKYPIIDVLCYYYIFNSYIPTLTHLNVILHRLTHLERNLDLNPLTTNKYRCINQINQSIMVYPVSLQNATVINHVDNYDSEMLDMFPNDIIENDTIQGQIDDDKYDYSILGSIDPDTHYFPNQRNLVCKNYTEESFNKYFYFQNNFSLYHVNIRSTPENLKQLIYYIQGIKYKFSVFAISETWLKNYNDTLYNIKGYSHECVNRENCPEGGVSLYIRNDLTYRIRTDLSIELIDIDIIFIEIPKTNLNTNTNILIGVCYRPPHVSATEFIEKLDEILQKLQREKSVIYFCGDFNFNILGISPAANCKSNEFHNTFLSHAFNPLIVDLPTRVNKVTGTYTLIDNIYTNHTNHLENCQGAILKTTFSDHYSIIAISKFIFTTKQSTLISRREFTDKNKYKLLKKLQLQNWDYIYNTS